MSFTAALRAQAMFGYCAAFVNDTLILQLGTTWRAVSAESTETEE
jgi:hypothetical protein